MTHRREIVDHTLRWQVAKSGSYGLPSCPMELISSLIDRNGLPTSAARTNHGKVGNRQGTIYRGHFRQLRTRNDMGRTQTPTQQGIGQPMLNVEVYVFPAFKLWPPVDGRN